VGKRPDTLPDLTLQRLSEIEALLTHESSVAFYSYRAHESMWLLHAEVRRLRAAVDAALELTNGDFCPIPDDAKNMRGRAGWHFAMDHIRAALTPVADPDPHTTSDEEQT
jgi:hypothetical protein